MKTIKDLAEISGRSKTAIRKTAAKLGILETAQRSESGTVLFTEDQAAQILQKIQDGGNLGTPGKETSHPSQPSDRSGPEPKEEPAQDQKEDPEADQAAEQNAPNAETLDAYRERIRAQEQEIQFLRSLVVSLQNEKTSLLQLAAPDRKPDTANPETQAETAPETRSEPVQTPAPQEPAEKPRKGLLWRIFHSGQ